MARTKTKGLRERILQETIKQGALVGISKVNPREVAKNCGVTDAVIYYNFGTKVNLLLQAKLSIDITMKKLIAEIIKENYTNNFEQAWMACFDYMIANPSSTTFLNRYRHSEYFDLALDFQDADFNDTILATILHIYDKCNKNNLIYKTIWIHLVDSTINFADYITSGILSNDIATKKIIYKLIFSSIMEYKHYM